MLGLVQGASSPLPLLFDTNNFLFKTFNEVNTLNIIDGGEWSASRPRRFTPGGNRTRYPLDRRLGGPQNRSRRREEDKILDYRDSNSDPSDVQPVASGFTDCARVKEALVQQ
jgi:hypothetical protein